LTYRSFMSPAHFLELLIRRYLRFSRILQEAKDEQTKKSAKVVLLRVLNVLKHWLSDHFYDFEGNERLMIRTIEFLDHYVVPSGLSTPATQVKKLLKKKITGSVRRKPMEFDVSRIPKSIYPKNMSDFAFLDLDPVEIARQETLIEHSLYKQIRPRECLNQSWNKSNKELVAPNIHAIIQRFNNFNRFLISLIVQTKNLQKRAKLIERIICVAQHFRQLNNFNGLMTILSSLESTAIYRLKKTFESVNSKLLNSLNDMKCTMTHENNFSTFRHTLHNETPPCIPYLGVYLTDLTFLEQGTTDVLPSNTELINFAKRQKIALVIREIQQYQQTPYLLHTIPDIQQYLLNPHDVELLDPDQAFNMSLLIEPRERNHSLTK